MVIFSTTLNFSKRPLCFHSSCFVSLIFTCSTFLFLYSMIFLILSSSSLSKFFPSTSSTSFSLSWAIPNSFPSSLYFLSYLHPPSGSWQSTMWSLTTHSFLFLLYVVPLLHLSLAPLSLLLFFPCHLYPLHPGFGVIFYVRLAHLHSFLTSQGGNTQNFSFK